MDHEHRLDRQIAESLLSGARSRLVNVCYYTMVVMGYLVIPVFVLRVQTNGWGLSATIHAIIVPIGTVLAFFLPRFSLRTRSTLLILISLVSALGGLLTYGIVGSGFFGMAIMAVVVAAITLGQRAGILTVLAGVGAFLAVMALVMTRAYALAPHLDDYAMSPTGWVVAIVGFVLFSLLLIIGIQAMHNVLAEVIDAKIRASRAVEQKSVFLESILESTHALLLVLNPQLEVTRVNRACLGLIHRPEGHVLGEPFAETLFLTNRQQGVRQSFAEGNPGGEDTWHTGDDREVVVAWNASAVRAEGEGEVQYWIVSGMDVTAERQLQRELQQGDKMRSIGQLAGGIAHDFNNMLTAILGSAEMIGRQQGPSGPSPHVHTILASCRKASDLTRQLLSFSRVEAGPLQTLDLHGAVRDALQLFAPSTREGLTLRTELADQPLFIEGEPTHIVNAILNLVLNARDAIDNVGNITVRTCRREVDDRGSLGMLKELKPGQYAEITVADDGAGITPENLGRMFEPFFTTKERGKGTGLGLASVYGTVHRHHGAIRVFSEPGVGTSFHMFLPCVEGSPTVVAPSRVSPVSPVPPLSVVLIEDDASIRSTTQEMLADFGHEVQTASNGREGLDVLAGQSGEVDVVILDWVMPVLGGRETLEAIRSAYPTLPVIVSSGFAPGHEALRPHLDEKILFFLQKPYRAEELLALIGRIHAQGA
jgi:signal transduction histidine kinase